MDPQKRTTEVAVAIIFMIVVLMVGAASADRKNNHKAPADTMFCTDYPELCRGRGLK